MVLCPRSPGVFSSSVSLPRRFLILSPIILFSSRAYFFTLCLTYTFYPVSFDTNLITNLTFILATVPQGQPCPIIGVYISYNVHQIQLVLIYIYVMISRYIPIAPNPLPLYLQNKYKINKGKKLFF